LRASLTALPAWNRTALLAAIWMWFCHLWIMTRRALSGQASPAGGQQKFGAGRLVEKIEVPSSWHKLLS
jgi:hypothetical protein